MYLSGRDYVPCTAYTFDQDHFQAGAAPTDGTYSVAFEIRYIDSIREASGVSPFYK